jgi:RNase P/RNase MRP subunit POP5
MAANYRQVIRGGLVAALTARFNSINVALANSLAYGVPPLEIDFSDNSNNFVQGSLDPIDFEASTAAIQLPGMVLYGTEALDEKNVKSMGSTYRFSGSVIYQLDLYLQYRALSDTETASNSISEVQATRQLEVFGDCAEDSILSTLTDPATLAAFATLQFSRTDYKSVRDPVKLFGDGFLQRVAFALGFKIHLR